MEKITGGWLMNREIFSNQACSVFEIAVEHRRLTLVLPNEALKGPRFNANSSILTRLESMYSEEEFMNNIGPCIDKALVDAGQSDWWYQNECDYKWRDDPPEEDCTVDDDE